MELNNVEGVEGVLKVWIRRVWTLEMVGNPFIDAAQGTGYMNSIADNNLQSVIGLR